MLRRKLCSKAVPQALLQCCAASSTARLEVANSSVGKVPATASGGKQYTLLPNPLNRGQNRNKARHSVALLGIAAAKPRVDIAKLLSSNLLPTNLSSYGVQIILYFF